MFWLKVHEIPIGSPTAQGKAIVNLLQFGEDEKLATILPVREFIPGPLPGDGHPAGHHQENRPDELPAAPERRHHRLSAWTPRTS